MMRVAPIVALALIWAPGVSASLPAGPPAPPPILVPMPSDAGWPALAVDVPASVVAAALMGDAVDPQALRGSATVQLRLLTAVPRVGWSVVVEIPELSVGETALGALRLRVVSMASEPTVMADLFVAGPLGDVQFAAMWDAPAASDRLAAGLSRMVSMATPPSEKADDAPSDAPVEADDPAPSVLYGRAAQLDLERLTDVFPGLAARGIASAWMQLDARGLYGAIGSRDGWWRGGPLGDTRIDVAIRPDQARAMATFGAHPTRIELSASVPVRFDPRTLDVTWLDALPMSASLVARDLVPRSVLSFHRFHPAADFTAGLELTASGTLDALSVEGRLSGTLIDGDRERPLTGRMALGPAAQSTAFAVGEVLNFEVATTADLVALRRSSARPHATAMSGALTAAIPLPTLLPYLPQGIHDPIGTLEGSVALSGTLAEPSFDGRLTVEEGALTIVAANARVVDLDLDAVFEGQTARLERCRGESGRGAIEATGQAAMVVTPPGDDSPLWSAWTVAANLGLDVRDVPFVQPGSPAGLLDARVGVELSARPDDAELKVRIDRTTLDLTRFRLPGARPIARNSAIRRHDMGGAIRQAESWLVGEGHLVVVVELPEPIVVDGPDNALRLMGTITLERQDDIFTVEGDIATLSGRFSLFDNAFELTEGTMTIQPGTVAPEAAVAVAIGQASMIDTNAPPAAETLDAVIDISARARIVDTDVFVRLRGPNRRPTLVLESDPPLPEYQILTLLITGRVDAIDDRNGEVRRQAARLIDRFHNPSLARQLYDRLGVDKLGLKFGASVANPILTVGKQINRRLYVETVYRHDAPPDENEKEARVEYRLSPRWTVDTTAGDAGEGTLGLFWHTSFGAPERPKRVDDRTEPGADPAPSDDDEVEPASK